jgi:hypothetical protein
LKNISQWEGLSHKLWNIKNVPNHQPAMFSTPMLVYRREKKHTFWGGWTWARSCAGPPRDDVPQKMEPRGIDRISVTFGQDKPACID